MNVQTLVLTGYGINCEEETGYAFQRAGSKVTVLHINELLARKERLLDFHILALPGGFSYGDHIASGKIFANKLRLKLEYELSYFIKTGRGVLGICNGFQVLIKTGLLPGYLPDAKLSNFENSRKVFGKQRLSIVENARARFEDRWVRLGHSAQLFKKKPSKSSSAPSCFWLQGIENLKNVLFMPVRHGLGRVVQLGRADFETMLAHGCEALCYVDAKGKLSENYPINPNGSAWGLAGLSNYFGNVFGLMPHPEAASYLEILPELEREEFKQRHANSKDHFLFSQNDGPGMAFFYNGVRFIREKFLDGAKPAVLNLENSINLPSLGYKKKQPAPKAGHALKLQEALQQAETWLLSVQDKALIQETQEYIQKVQNMPVSLKPNTAKLRGEKKQIKNIQDAKQAHEYRVKDFIDSFSTSLSFGTGGIRAVMGPGMNRMNTAVVSDIALGLINYAKKKLAKHEYCVSKNSGVLALPTKKKNLRFLIAYDTRNLSREFSMAAARVLCSGGATVFIWDTPRPTPELSYSLPLLEADYGLVITASHNPKEYNGCKVYAASGVQVLPPEDTGIAAEIIKVQKERYRLLPQALEVFSVSRLSGLLEKELALLKFRRQAKNSGGDYISWLKTLANLAAGKAILLDKKFDEFYIQAIQKSLYLKQKRKTVKLLYSPLHGAGIQIMPEAFKQAGFLNFQVLKEQSSMDGNFPSVALPNPEEDSAMRLLLLKAKSQKYHLALASDPDCDRIRAAVPKKLQAKVFEYKLLNGNQIALLLADYIFSQYAKKIKQKKLLRKSSKSFLNQRQKAKQTRPAIGYMLRTLVTTPMLDAVAKKYSIQPITTLTGFKYMAARMQEKQEKQENEIDGSIKNSKSHFLPFVFAAEESCGYLALGGARDKDAVQAALLLAEAAQLSAQQGESLYQRLQELYKEHGLFAEKLISLEKHGAAGRAEIKRFLEKLQMKIGLASATPMLAGKQVLKIHDFEARKSRCWAEGKPSNVKRENDYPRSLGLLYLLEDGSQITVRPSGTEPKIKFYFSCRSTLAATAKIGSLAKAKGATTLESQQATLNKRILRLSEFFLRLSMEE